MERKPCLLVPLAVAGTLAGLGYGRSQPFDLWPDYARSYALRCAGVGWLAGLALAGVLLLVSRPRSGPARRPIRFVRAARVAAMALAFAPGALWVSALLPGSPLRQTMRVRFPVGRHGPDIVLITIDALRADHLGAYGSEAGLTPNLDAFAREATVYQSAMAASPWTLASLGALLTGLPPSQSITVRKGGEDTTAYAGRAALLSRAPLLPEALSGAGYLTAAELTNPFLSAGRGWERGFDFFHNEDGGDALVLLAGETARADTVTQHARAWLALKRRPPFFLWVHYLDPHAPYDSPDAPDTLRRAYPAAWDTTRTYWQEAIADATPEEQARFAEYCRALYAEEVRYADRWVGEVLADLKRGGWYDDTAIVITSDHGEELFEHGGFEHGHSLYAEVLHVPLLVKWPKGTAADRTVAQTVSLESLGPTLLELAHVPERDRAPASALPRFAGGAGAGVYSEAPLYGPDQTALTTDDYTVIYHLPIGEGGGSYEVYDRRADPGEKRDLAGEGAAKTERERLRRMTEAAVAAREHGTAGQALEKLDETAKRRLRSLGYLSN